MSGIYRIGQTVETSTHQQGLVKYVGSIHVSDGLWLGVELSTATGKNDGSVRGERYFSCPPAHGLFVRDSSILRVVSQPVPSTPTPAPRAAAPKPKSAAPAPKARPASVVAPPNRAQRASTVTKRQSVASTPSYSALRPTRKPSVASIASTSVTSPSESSTRPAQPAPRLSTSSTATTQSNLKSSTRDNNVETLQTRIRHLEKQHSEDQERLRELVQIKDERDRFHKIIEKLQSKCQTQHGEAQELKEKLKALQHESESLSRGQQEHEVDLEDALVDKEMAEERADQAEAEIESLRKRIEERDLELDILREEAELYTTEMSEEQKQDAGYYRLQHENERLRNALIGLKEMTEEKEQDYMARILSLETDLTHFDTYERDNSTLQQRLTESEAVIEDLKQRLEAASEWEDMVAELSNQNQDFQDRIAEQDLVVQDLENLRELNDELEIQHLEQEEELRAELEVKDNELAEQAQRIVEQTSIIADHETLISKFRDLVVDLQAKMADAESSKTMTEAQVKDTTGRFNEVMDMNRQLRAATVQSTTREIDAVVLALKNDQLSEQLDIWNVTESKEFTRSESLQTYLTSKRIAGKSQLLSNVLVSTRRQMSNGGRLDDAFSRLVCSEALSHLTFLRDGSNRLWSTIRSSSLSQFANFGPTYQELITVEHNLDQGLVALKADAVNFDEFAGSLGRSTKIYEAVLMGHQEALSSRPEDELLSRVTSLKSRLHYIDYIYELVADSLQKAPTSVLEACEGVLEHFKVPLETTKGAVTAATKLKRTLVALHKDAMYPQLPDGLEEVIQQDERLARTAEDLTTFARKLIEEVMKCSNLSEDDSVAASEIEWSKRHIDELDLTQRTTFGVSGLSTLTITLRHWTDYASVLMNNTEIERGPTPWAQKAKQVEAARKKDDEIARHLETLTAEHRATILKIHEREQVIATKELEIEHLLAKNRDAAAKTEDAEALQAELVKRNDKIMELQAERRAQTIELIALRERRARSDHSEKDDTEPAMSNATPGVAPVERPSSPQSAPAGLKSLLDALQNENHWLREREQKDALDRNLRQIFGRLAHMREMEQIAFGTHPDMVEMMLDSSWLSDEDEDELDEDNAPLGLREVQLGWQSRSESLKETFEAYEELSTIMEEDEDFSVVLL